MIKDKDVSYFSGLLKTIAVLCAFVFSLHPPERKNFIDRLLERDPPTKRKRMLLFFLLMVLIVGIAIVGMVLTKYTK